MKRFGNAIRGSSSAPSPVMGRTVRTAIVRATTQRELDLIVRLGYLLGAIVGTAAYAVSLLVT